SRPEITTPPGSIGVSHRCERLLNRDGAANFTRTVQPRSSGGFAAAIRRGEAGRSTPQACDDRRNGGVATSEYCMPYRNYGSQSVMPGQMYMNTRQIHTMSMYGIMPAKIWFNVTCRGETPFR